MLRIDFNNVEADDLPPQQTGNVIISDGPDLVYRILLEQEGEPTLHEPAGSPEGGRFTSKPSSDTGGSSSGGSETDKITPADLPKSDGEDESDEDDTDDDDTVDDTDDDTEADNWNEIDDTLASGKHAKLLRYSIRSQGNEADGTDNISIEIHDLRDFDDSESDWQCRTYVNGELYDTENFDTAKEAVSYQRSQDREMKQLGKETEREYRDQLSAACKAARDSAQTGSPEADVFRCLGRQLKKTGQADSVQAALRTAGICK